MYVHKAEFHIYLLIFKNIITFLNKVGNCDRRIIASQHNLFHQIIMTILYLTWNHGCYHQIIMTILYLTWAHGSQEKTWHTKTTKPTCLHKMQSRSLNSLSASRTRKSQSTQFHMYENMLYTCTVKCTQLENTDWGRM